MYKILLVSILAGIAGVLLKQNKNIKAMANELDNLTNEVAENTSTVQSAITLLNGLKTKLDEAIASNDMSQVQALSDQLSGNTDALAAAVAANTPAEPPTEEPQG